ncbi:hypothetical protein ACJ72_00818 [Emergomyces africanus]|uniref:Uncharacterized protein n=1 Tax=Emergomyces africanus TaxID=1955775 RepID=A0A1B7P6Y0_9EURO|nr:hypothetical protein ACJ72_00818 [Emergomyces africanus]
MGKVHGSLARAGKVKSQTPKVSFRLVFFNSQPFLEEKPFSDLVSKKRSSTGMVEPQEKKKTPKGRAKKRLQHSRRFNNVTMTGGKRKNEMEGTNGARAAIRAEETWH